MKKLIKKIKNWLNRNNTVKTPMREEFSELNPVRIRTVTSRYGAPRIISQIGSCTYKVEGLSHYCRGSYDPDGDWEMFDFEGGPCYFLGQRFPFDNSSTLITKLSRNWKAAESSDRLHCTVIVTVI